MNEEETAEQDCYGVEGTDYQDLTEEEQQDLLQAVKEGEIVHWNNKLLVDLE